MYHFRTGGPSVIASSFLVVLQVMEREEPMGYVIAHPEKKFRVLTNKHNFTLECTVEQDGNIQKVPSCFSYCLIIKRFVTLLKQFLLIFI